MLTLGTPLSVEVVKLPCSFFLLLVTHVGEAMTQFFFFFYQVMKVFMPRVDKPRPASHMRLLLYIYICPVEIC